MTTRLGKLLEMVLLLQQAELLPHHTLLVKAQCHIVFANINFYHLVRLSFLLLERTGCEAP
jgi:hypothetical protein